MLQLMASLGAAGISLDGNDVLCYAVAFFSIENPRGDLRSPRFDGDDDESLRPISPAVMLSHDHKAGRSLWCRAYTPTVEEVARRDRAEEERKRLAEAAQVQRRAAAIDAALERYWRASTLRGADTQVHWPGLDQVRSRELRQMLKPLRDAVPRHLHTAGCRSLLRSLARDEVARGEGRDV